MSREDDAIQKNEMISVSEAQVRKGVAAALGVGAGMLIFFRGATALAPAAWLALFGAAIMLYKMGVDSE